MAIDREQQVLLLRQSISARGRERYTSGEEKGARSICVVNVQR